MGEIRGGCFEGSEVGSVGQFGLKVTAEDAPVLYKVAVFLDEGGAGLGEEDGFEGDCVYADRRRCVNEAACQISLVRCPTMGFLELV